MERQGRGAWPSDGRGGTLNAKGTAAGRYYALAADPLREVGLAAVCDQIQNKPTTTDRNAVFHGVLAIQAFLVEDFKVSLKGDGVYGPETAQAVKNAQSFFGILSDGVVGKETMMWFLWPHIHEIAQHYNVPWNVIWGFLQNEGNWDPGAVGWLDSNDLGLLQINLKAHPDITPSEALCPSYCLHFLGKYISAALKEFNGNIIDSVISYNLGFGGTRQWINDGRPVFWTPSWSNLERRPFEYADRIINSAEN